MNKNAIDTNNDSDNDDETGIAEDIAVARDAAMEVFAERFTPLHALRVFDLMVDGDDDCEELKEKLLLAKEISVETFGDAGKNPDVICEVAHRLEGGSGVDATLDEIVESLPKRRK